MRHSNASFASIVGGSLALLTAVAAYARPVPPNDNCSSAITVTAGSVAFDNTGATDDGAVDCQGGTHKNVWFRYVTTTQCRVNVNTCGSPVEMALTVWEGCGFSDPIVCSSTNPPLCGAGSKQASVYLIANYGQELYISVGSHYGATGAGTLHIVETPLSVPENDDCSRTTEVGVGTFPIDNMLAATDPSHASCNDSGAEMYYLFTPPATGTYYIETQDDGTTSLFDTVLSLYHDFACSGSSGEPLNSSQFACDDNGAGSTTAFGSAYSALTYNATTTTPVLIRVAGYRSTAIVLPGGNTIFSTLKGTALLHIFHPVPPPNDNCAGATDVTVGITTLDGRFSTSDSSAQASCGASGNEIYFRFVPGVTGTYRFRTVNHFTVMSLYGSCGGVELACDAGTHQPLVAFPKLDYPCTAGVPVILRVGFLAVFGGYDPAQGPLDIALLVPPANDSCAGATAAALGENAYDTSLATSDGTVSSCGVSGLEVYFKYTVTAPDYVTLETKVPGAGSSSRLDYTMLTVYDGCSGVELACNDNAGSTTCGVSSICALPVSPGHTYIIRVAGDLGCDGSPTVHKGAGTLVLRSVASTIANEHCGQAIPLTLPFLPLPPVPPSTIAPANFDTSQSCDGEVWYSIAAEPHSVYHISIEDAPFDPSIRAYDGCGGPLLGYDNVYAYGSPPFGCGFNGAPCASDLYICSASSPTLIFSIGAEKSPPFGGTTKGAGHLSVTKIPTVPNDTCATAAAIAPGDTFWDNTGACTAVTTGSCDNGGIGADIFFSYTPSAAGQATLSTAGSSLDSVVVSVVSGTCAGPEAGCGYGGTSFPVTAGTHYLIRVTSSSSSFHPRGPGVLHLTGPASASNCIADFDRDGTRTIDDIFVFLNAWFAHCDGTQSGPPCSGRSADIDGHNGVAIDDIFVYLNYWFAGCP